MAVSKTRALETITLGGGCFWCTEAVFSELKGVASVESGYAGGAVENPSYEDVCTGRTGHAEVVQVAFDPAVISLEDVLRVFFATHDPTTPNRQGADEGMQYRSVVFYRDDAQKQAAQKIMDDVQREGVYARPLVTQLVPFTKFFKAEEYHQRFYAKNPGQGYCNAVISPKLAAFRQKFKDKLKTTA